MPLERRSKQKIEIEDNGVIFVKTSTEIDDTDDNDKVVSPVSHHRQPFDPGINPLNEVPSGRVRDVAQLVWTPAVVQGRQRAIARQNP